MNRTLLTSTTAAALLVSTTALAGPPDVLCLTGKDVPGNTEIALARYTAAGDHTDVLTGLPLGGYALAVDAATGRWALTFGQLSNGDPLVIDGKTVSKALDRNTLVLGEGDKVVTTTKGDPACTNKKRACFETPLFFSADGAYVFVRAEGSSFATLSRWTFGAKPKRAAVTDKKHGGLHVAPDGAHASYLAGDGVHVTAWPAQKKKATKVKLTKKAVANPDLLMSDAWPIGDRLYWFRREPKEQKVGYYEAYDLGSGQTTTLYQAKADFSMSSGPFLPAGDSVVFTDNAGADHLDVLEATGDQVTAVAHDVKQVLDVSADGAYLLVTRIDAPGTLVILELATGKDVATVETGAGYVDSARFVASPS